MLAERRVVDDRVFLLGLDHLYRDAMRPHERRELLVCARRVAATLRVGPADVPVEGYYAKDAALKEYFRLIRALQGVGKEAKSSVASVPEFQRLLAVTSSPIFGVPKDEDRLLPAGWDALTHALFDLRPRWTLGGLTVAAYDAALANDDISLVGLAARVRDAVVLTAARESVVLYAAAGVFGRAPEPTYVWSVNDDLARQSGRFVDTFNGLFGEEIPRPEPAQAEQFWHAYEYNDIRGRCVRLGYDDTVSPTRHYHWAIREGANGDLMVEDFWKDEVWTTERYSAVLDEGTISGFYQQELPQSPPPRQRRWWELWHRG